METENKIKSTKGIFAQSMQQFNSSGQISRQDILNKISSEAISACWAVFSKAILRNYQSGKGTSIPKFGTFTFNNAEVNLEGTTNQFSRDIKAKKPVFIVSSDFVERLKPGISSSNGIIYYTQKQNSNTSHVKVNYSEMAFSLDFKKEDLVTVIDNIIKFIGDSIVKNQFRNKEMPGLGVLTVKNNIMAVIFNDEVIDSVKLAPQNLAQTKKRINLFMELDRKDGNESKKLMADSLPDLAKTLNSLRPKTAIITKITKGAENWLKENYDINLDDEETLSIDYMTKMSANNNNANPSIINDIKNVVNITPKKLDELRIPTNVLESIAFHKAIIISEMKNLDKSNTGMLKINEMLYALKKANIKDLTNQNMQDIINLYNENKNIAVGNLNYTNIMGTLLKDISINTKKNRPSTAFNTVSNSKQSSVKENNNSTTASNGLLLKKIQLEEVSKEIKTIKIIIDKIKAKNGTKLDQIISFSEFVNILREFSIVFPKEKLEKILIFIEISQISSFSLNEFISKLFACKILSSEMNTEEILVIIRKLKDIFFSLGGRVFLFPSLPTKTSITKEEFLELVASKSSYSKEILSSVYNYLTKVERPFTLDDYAKNFEDNRTHPLDEDFLIKAVKIITDKISKSSM